MLSAAKVTNFCLCQATHTHTLIAISITVAEKPEVDCMWWVDAGPWTSAISGLRYAKAGQFINRQSLTPPSLESHYLPLFFTPSSFIFAEVSLPPLFLPLSYFSFLCSVFVPPPPLCVRQMEKAKTGIGILKE